jgi:hypothetical protein
MGGGMTAACGSAVDRHGFRSGAGSFGSGTTADRGLSGRWARLAAVTRATAETATIPAIHRVRMGHLLE